MAQYRFTTFGNLIETADLPTVANSLFEPGRLIGGEFSVLGADLMAIDPCSVLLPDGVLIVEDENQQLVVPNSSVPADYTVVYQLEDSRVIGGSPANLRLISGVLRQSSFTDSTVLGWVRYPGSSVPLSPTHFIQPTPLRIGSKASTLSFLSYTPFADLLRAETKGSVSNIHVPIASMTQQGQEVLGISGQTTRLLSASVTTDLGIPSDTSNFMTYTLKNGVNSLFGIQTAGSSLTAKVPTPLIKTSSSPANFILTPTTPLIIESARSGLSPSPNMTGTIDLSGIPLWTETSGGYAFGEKDFGKTLTFKSGANNGVVAQINRVVSSLSVNISALYGSLVGATGVQTELQNRGAFSLTVETPAASGVWEESQVTFGTGERATKFQNNSSVVATQTLLLPFLIPESGQPKKVLSRLMVDYNCIVTMKLKVGSQYCLLTPSNGEISNTGSVVTREFDVVTNTAAVWTPGTTAFIEIGLNAQASGSANFVYFALSNEPTPFSIF